MGNSPSNRIKPAMEYRYLGDLSSTPPWHSRAMSCDTCRVSWTGCWDNFQCPQCGMGELPGFGGVDMSIDEIKKMHAGFLADSDKQETNQMEILDLLRKLPRPTS